MCGILDQESNIPSGHPLSGFRQARERCPEPRRRAMHRQLQIVNRAECLGLARLSEQEIQLSELRVSGNLRVPALPIQFAQPLSQARKLVCGQDQDGLLYLSDVCLHQYLDLYGYAQSILPLAHRGGPARGGME